MAQVEGEHMCSILCVCLQVGRGGGAMLGEN